MIESSLKARTAKLIRHSASALPKASLACLNEEALCLILRFVPRTSLLPLLAARRVSRDWQQSMDRFILLHATTIVLREVDVVDREGKGNEDSSEFQVSAPLLRGAHWSKSFHEEIKDGTDFDFSNSLVFDGPSLATNNGLMAAVWLCKMGTKLRVEIAPKSLQDLGSALSTLARHDLQVDVLRLCNCSFSSTASFERGDFTVQQVLRLLSTPLLALKQLEWLRRSWDPTTQTSTQMPDNDCLTSLQDTLMLITAVPFARLVRLDLSTTEVGCDVHNSNNSNNSRSCLQLSALASLPGLEELQIFSSLGEGQGEVEVCAGIVGFVATGEYTG
jgi:hypothetical protein